MKISIQEKLKKFAGLIICSGWYLFTLAFFLMITEGGETNMILEVGPYLKFQGSSAVYFTRGVLGFGVLMLILFIWRSRIGFILAFIWSVWWAAVLSTALLNAPDFSSRVAILIVVSLFIASAWYTFTRFQGKSKGA